MKPKLNPNYPTIPVLVLSIGMGLVVLAVSVIGAFDAYKGIVTGQIYSPTIVFAVKRIVSKSSEPIEYSTYIVLYTFGAIALFCGGLWGPIEAIGHYKKKRARQKKEREIQCQPKP